MLPWGTPERTGSSYRGIGPELACKNVFLVRLVVGRVFYLMDSLPHAQGSHAEGHYGVVLKRKSCAKFFRQIYREEGVRGLYRVSEALPIGSFSMHLYSSIPSVLPSLQPSLSPCRVWVRQLSVRQ